MTKKLFLSASAEDPKRKLGDEGGMRMAREDKSSSGFGGFRATSQADKSAAAFSEGGLKIPRTSVRGASFISLAVLAIIIFWYLALPAVVVLSLVPQIKKPLIDYVSFRPVKTSLALTQENFQIPLDIYEPQGKVRANLVIFHAANELGKDDPRLQRLAEILARSRFKVYVPTLPSLNRRVFHPRVVEEMAHVTKQAIHEHSSRKLFLMSFSIGVGPQLIAAARQDLKDEIDLLIAFGGYLDLENVISFHTTGDRQDPFGVWLLARYYAQFLPTADAQIFYEIAQRKWNNLEAKIDDLAGLLGPEGKAALALLLNQDPRLVETLLSALPPELKQFLAVFDPQPHLDNLEAQVLLLHSRSDPVIPFEESQKLLAALQEKNKPVKFIALEAFDHVNPVLPALTPSNLLTLYLPEFVSLYQAAFQIIY